MPEDGRPAIEAADLVKTYPGARRPAADRPNGVPRPASGSGGVEALRGVSFAVAPGTVFGLLGPNGAGKSTIVKVLTTLTLADSGRTAVAGIDVADHPDRVRDAIGCVFQKPAVDLEATGAENLTLQGHLHGMRGAELQRRVGELLDRFDLGDAAKRITRTYSGGMQRKLDVAMGLVHRPRVLFLDEPTTGLDPQARSELWAEVGRLARDEGLTVLLTTHYMEEADRLADRLAIVDRGRIVAEGTPEALKSEMRGDAIVVELAAEQPPDRVRGTLDRLNESLRDIALDGRTLRARVDGGASAVPAVLAALDSGRIPVASATVSRPSLDDVYLRYAGRAFSAADEEGTT